MSSHNSQVTEVQHLLVQNLLTYHHKLQVTFNSRNQAILPNNQVVLRTPSDNQDYHAVLLTIYLYINSSSSMNNEGPYLPSRGLMKYVSPRLLATSPNLH